MEEISKDEFELRFNKYYEENLRALKNPSLGYWSSYGWYLNERRKYKVSLEAKNIKVVA